MGGGGARVDARVTGFCSAVLGDVTRAAARFGNTDRICPLPLSPLSPPFSRQSRPNTAVPCVDTHTHTLKLRYDTYQDEVRLLVGGAGSYAARKQLAGPRD